MTLETKSLGKLVAVHPISPAHMQRAVFIAVLAFLFFLAMMFAFYLRQNILYFLLSTAFLLVYLLTMFSLVVQRRSVLEIFERGIKYKKRSAAWHEIAEVRDDGTLTINGQKPLVISSAINSLENALDHIRAQARLR